MGSKGVERRRGSDGQAGADPAQMKPSERVKILVKTSDWSAFREPMRTEGASVKILTSLNRNFI
jgi:hypothetical protein